MIPKEKAQQLIYAFEEFTDRDNELEFAKQCASIAVDEIIKTITNIHWRTYVSIYIQEEYMNIDEAIEYWQEVKKEIEKL